MVAQWLALKQEGCWFDTRPGTVLGRVCMFFLCVCVCEFSLGTLASSHSPETQTGLLGTINSL